MKVNKYDTWLEIVHKSHRNRPLRTIEVSQSTETTHPDCIAATTIHFLFQANAFCIIHFQNFVSIS